MKCPFCGKDFRNLIALQKHVKAFHPIGNYCPVCKAKVTGLTIHLSKNHLKDEKHMVLYVIYTKSNGANRDYLGKLKDKVIEILETEDINF